MCCGCGGGSTYTGTPSPTASGRRRRTATRAPTPPGCTDTNNAARDNGGDGCTWGGYLAGGSNSQCGNYDDSDFAACTMCCGCGGGSVSSVSPASCTSARRRRTYTDRR